MRRFRRAICTKARLLPGVRCWVSITRHSSPLCMMAMPLRMSFPVAIEVSVEEPRMLAQGGRPDQAEIGRSSIGRPRGYLVRHRARAASRTSRRLAELSSATPAAGVVLGYGAQEPPVQEAQLHRYGAPGRVHRGRLPRQLQAGGLEDADPEARGLLQRQPGQPARVFGPAQHGEEGRGAVLLHLHRGVEGVQRSLLQDALQRMAQVLRGVVVQVASQLADPILLQVRGGSLSAEDHAQHVGTALQLPGAQPVADPVGHEALHGGRRIGRTAPEGPPRWE